MGLGGRDITKNMIKKIIKKVSSKSESLIFVGK